MIQFILQRREELQRFPKSVATASPTYGIGSQGNTGHLYLGHRPVSPRPPAPYSPKASWDK